LPGYIKKHQASVRVCLPGQDPIDGTLSLSPDSPFHSGPQTILELLNSQLRMIPFLLASSNDDVLLLTRVNIDWVVAGSGVEAELIQSRLLPITREENVLVTFSDGRVIDGFIQIELPEGMNRVSDYLNGPYDFFPLRTRLGVVCINKARVRDTRLTAARVPSPSH
jgi:hypothetical protein